MSDFLKIYEEHRDALYNFILRRIGNEADAEDIVSDVFVKAIRFEKDGGVVTHARGLLYKIARNSIIDNLKARRKFVFIDDDNSEDDDESSRKKEFVDPLPLVTTFIDRDLQAAEIESVLNRLRKGSRGIIELRYFQQLEIEEIAVMLEKSEGAVRVQLHRAMSELREIFPQYSNERS